MTFYCGWGLSKEVRNALLMCFPARHEDVRCDHITYDLCEVEEVVLLFANIEVYGHFDVDGYQALACKVNGEIYQPRGDRMYHITISHKPGHPSSHAGVAMAMRPFFVERIVPFPLETTPFVRKLAS